jgi:hypothetical protein
MNKTFLCLILCFVSTAFSQRTEPGSAAELAAITDRGRALYAYDLAAWHATDAVLALKPQDGSIGSYIAKRVGDKWTVVFGKLNTDRSAYLVAYEATQSTPKEFTVKSFATPKEEKGFFRLAALAIDLAKESFEGANRPYNVAVLPAEADHLFIYLLPAQTEQGVFPLGGDVRFKVSPDSTKVIEKRQLHKSIIEFRVPEGQIPQSGYHTAILDDIPEDTDVFHVLARRPSVPELVVTNKFVYQVKVDGSIIYMMTREAFQRVGKPSN